MLTPLKIISFDVFDTLLTRVYANPSDLFFDIANQILDTKGSLASRNIDEYSFTKARLQAWEVAKTQSGREDVSLHIVYHTLRTMLGISEYDSEDMLKKELELEMAAIRPVHKALEEIAFYRTKGHRIIFLSDTFHSESFITDLLRSCGAWEQGDSVYVSSEIGLTKITTNLYKHVIRKEGVKSKEILHIGNDVVSDLQSPRRTGIRSSLFGDANLNRYEHFIAQHKALPHMHASLIAGACRLARLDCPYSDPKRRTIWNTAANIAAPVLSCFVMWVFTEAKNKGIDRLYFVSRDGQILYRIAKVLAARINTTFELRYLYGSRQAWHLASLDGIGDYERSWIFEPTKYLSVRSLLARVGLRPEELNDVLIENGFPPGAWETNLNSEDRIAMKVLLERPLAVGNMHMKAAAARKVTEQYFLQEGLLEECSSAIVDIGWKGRLQHSLTRILRRMGFSDDIYGLYFGLYKEGGFCAPELCSSFLANRPTQRSGHSIPAYIAALMEIFAAADHGMVLGYEHGNERVRPILREEVNRSGVLWGVEVEQEAILRFLHHLPTQAFISDILGQVPQFCVDIASEFSRKPSSDEAAVFGDFLFAEDQNEFGAQPLASPLRWHNFFQYAVTGRRPLRHYQDWYEGSVCISSYSVRKAFQMHDKARTLLHSLLVKLR